MEPGDSPRMTRMPPGSGAGDVERLAAHSPGVDASAYFDCQEQAALAAAVAAWPFLARLLDVDGAAADGGALTSGG